jgi:hypothetical protein
MRDWPMLIASVMARSSSVVCTALVEADSAANRQIAATHLAIKES